MTLSRRTALAALAATPALIAAPAVARPPGPLTVPPAIAQLRVGRVTVSFLSDGVLDAPTAWFTGLPAEELRRMVAARNGGDGSAFRIGFITWLIDDGERLVLVDTGPGANAGPTAGRVVAGLRALGVAPEQVDIVALTHTHFDHVGGLVAGGRAFPSAEVLAPRADLAHFTDPARRAAVPEAFRGSYDLTAQAVALYPRLQRIDGERAITPFVTSVDLAGHTPGHTGFRIADGGQSLWVIGDAMFSPAFHPAADRVGIVFEEDAAAARAMRTRLFARAAEDGAMLSATHMPFPGLGRIVRDGGTLSWAPADFPQAD